MSDTVIKVDNISKRYVLGHQRDKGDGLRHAIETAVRRPLQWLRNRKRELLDAQEEFWALKEVSFQVNRGDVTGIIGRNGAGKSTLLKILSRITEPTAGRIEIAGRVASLLEVGTGFHGDLSGRENIFLNGAILGMSRVEIKRKFDEIVAFSEVEKFLDTPVKRYSSGMYVRLAFAVAAHLEPEILIVDEVLAVGDQAFQKKCLGKMNEVARGGRTVLFVSHNMAVMRQLCSAGLLLDQGRVLKAGAIGEVVNTYLAAGVEHEGHWRRTKPLPESPGIYLEEISVFNHAGKLAGHLDCTEDFVIEVKATANGSFSKGQIAINFFNKEGVAVLTTAHSDAARQYVTVKPGRHCFRASIPGNFLAPDNYSLRVVAHSPHVQLHDLVENLVSFRIEDVGSLRSIFRDERGSVVEPVLAWTDTIEPAEKTGGAK
jgi:lipopolysaccharide transport system ATP-binding protein